MLSIEGVPPARVPEDAVLHAAALLVLVSMAWIPASGSHFTDARAARRVKRRVLYANGTKLESFQSGGIGDMLCVRGRNQER